MATANNWWEDPEELALLESKRAAAALEELEDEEPDQEEETAPSVALPPNRVDNLETQPEDFANLSRVTANWWDNPEELARLKQSREDAGIIQTGISQIRPDRGALEELGVGIERGKDQTQGLGYGFVGLLGQAVGLEGVEEYGVENYLRKMEEAAMNQASVRDPFEEIEDLGDAGLYAAGIIGEQIPQLLASALGGGIGGLAAKTIGKRVVGNMINKRVSAGLAGQTFADDAARAVATGNLRARAAEDIAKETAGTLLANAGRAGGVSGAYLANFGQISGGSFGQMAQELGRGDAGIAAGFAVGGAALDTLGEVFIASKFLKPFSKTQRAAAEGVDTSLSLGRVGGGAATGFAAGSAIEGGTEYVQTGLEQAALGAADPNRTIEDVVMTPEAERERRIAAVAGATVGAPLGGVGGAFEVAFSPRTTQTLNDRARQTQTTQTTPEITPAILTTEGWEEPVTVGENIRIARSRNGLFAGIDLPEELASDFQTVTDEDGRRISLLVDDLEVGEKTATLIQDARMAYAQKANLLPQREFDFVSGLPKEESEGDYNPPTEEAEPAAGQPDPGTREVGDDDTGVITPQPTGTPPETGPTGGQAEFTFEAATSAPRPSRSPGMTEQRSEPATAGTGILPVGAAAAPAPAPAPAAPATAPIAVPPQQTPTAPSIKGELDPDARDTKQATRASETLSRPVETVAPFVESLKEGDRVSVAMPNARNRKAKMVPAVFAQRLENGDAVFQLEDGKSVMIPPEKFNRVGMFRPEDTKTAPVAKVTKEQLGPTPTKAKIEQTFGVQNYKPGQTLKQTVTDGNGDAPVPVLTRLLKKKGSENDYLVDTEGEFTNDPLASVRQMNAGLPIYLPENQDLNLLSPDIEVTPVEVAGGGTRNKVTAVNLWGRTYRQGAEPSDFSVSRAPDGGMSQGETRGLGVFNSIYRLSPERMRRSAAGMQAARTREQAKRMKPEELAAGLNNLDPVDQAILEDGAQRALAYINRKTSTKGQATTDETRDAARDLATDNIMIDVVKAASARKDKLPAASVPVARRVISAFNDLLTRPIAAGQRRDTQAEAQRAGESVIGELVAAGSTEVEARAAVAPIISRVSAISSPISAAEDALKSATKTAIRTEANQAAATADLAEGTVGEAAAPKPASGRAKAPSRAEAAKIETMAQRKARLTEEDEDLMQAMLAGEELRGPDVARVEEIEAYLSGSKTYEEIYTEAQRAGRPELSDLVRGRTAGQKVPGTTESRAGRTDGSRSTRGAVGVGGPDRTESGTVPGVPAQQDGGSGVRVSAGLTPAEQRARALGARRFLLQRFFRLTDEEANAATEGQLDRAYDAIRTVLSPTAANQGRRAVAATKAQQVADLADARPEDLLAGVAQERAEALRNRQRTENVRLLAAEMFRGGAFDSTRNLLEFIANTKSLPRDMQLRAKSALGLQSRGFNWNNVATQIGIFRNRDGSRTTWAGLLGKDRDGGKSIAINLDNGHDRGTTYQTFLHEIQHVLNDAKWDAYYGLPGGQNLKLNKTELSAIKRVENFWKRAVKAAAEEREIAFPDSPTDADYARIGEELYALSDPNLDDADRRMAALRNPRELSVEITSSPEVAELLAELGFGKADKDGKVAVKGAIKEAWDALVQLEAGTVADVGSPLAMAFKDAMAINFAETGNKKVDARYTVPGSEPSALTRELDELRTASDFVEAELERRGLPGTSEQRAAILEEYEVTRREPTDSELDTVGDPETMSRGVAPSQENIPGSRSRLLAGLANAPYATKLDYHQQVNAALIDPETGNDTIAEMLGMVSPAIETTGPSVYSPSPGVVEFNPADILTGFGSVEDATRYMILRGAFTNQNAVAGIDPVATGQKDAAIFDLGRVPTEAEIRQVYGALKNPGDTAVFLNKSGLSVVKLGFDDSHDAVWNDSLDAIQNLLRVVAGPFKTDTIYHENEYSVSTDPAADEYGLNFQTAATKLALGQTLAARPLDLQTGAAVRLRERVAGINQAFADQGFGSPDAAPSRLLQDLGLDTPTNENLTESRAASASPNLVYQDSEGELRGRPRAATDRRYLRSTLLRLKQSSNEGRDLGAGETVRFRADTSGQTDLELERQRRSQGAEAFRRLIEILEEDGAVLDPETFENTVIEGRDKVGDGSEHQVHSDKPTNRVVKYTNPDVTGSGVVGQSLNVFDYLTNLEAQNEIFGDDIRLEGIVNLGEPYPRLVISQPFVKGRNSTQPQIDAYFGERGFEKQEDGSWIRVRDGQIQRVWDAVPGNLKTVKVGKKSTVVPFDVQISIQSNAGQGSVQAPSESRATGRFLRERVRVTPTGGTISQGGMFSVDELLPEKVGDAFRSSRMAIKADVSVITELSRLLERQMKSLYRGQEVPRETINTALGNLENPLNSQQIAEIESLFNSRRPKQAAKKRDQFIRENRKRFREETQPAALAQLPEELAATIREMSSHIESLSRRLVEKGGPVSGNLAVTVDEALGTYLNRSYAIFDDPNWSESVRKNAKVMDAARKFIRNGLIQSKTADLIDDAASEGRVISLGDAQSMANDSVTDAEIEAMLDGYLAVGDEAPSIEILSGRIPGQKNLSMLNPRGNIAPEIQALWGRYEDPTVNYAKTVMKLSSVIANNQFLTDLRKMGIEEGWLWSTENNPGDLRHPPGYVRISTENNPALAPLGGMYAHPMLAEGLFKMFPVGSIDQHYWWLSATMKLTGISMAMKTVGSVASQVRNYFGNYLNLVATGNLGLGDIASGDFAKRFNNSNDTILANTFNKYRNATRAEWRIKIDDYIRRGIVGESVTTGLLEDMLTASRKAGSPDFGDVVWSKVSEPFKRVTDFAVKTYSAGDDWFKVMIYEAEQDKYRKAFPAWDDNKVKETAAKIARDIHWTYSLAPAIVQDLKKFPFIAPFVTFTTEVIRTTYNLQKLARKEIMDGRASGNKELEAMGWKRVRGMTTAAFLPLAVGSASMAIAGISGEDEEDLRRFLPDWQKNSQLILFRKESGEVSFLDVSFLDPYEYFKKPLIAFMRSLREADSADEILLGGTMAMVRQALDPFTSEQIFAGAIMDVMRNQDAAGRQVYNPQDTGANIGTAVASKIFIEPFTPGTLTSFDRIGKAAFGMQSESGRAYGLFNEIASVTTGQRISKMDAQQALQFKGSRFMREMRDASALFNREFVSQGTRSAGDVVSGYDRSNGARRALVGSIRKDYLAAIRLGVPVARAKAILRDAGVGRETLRMATTGIYKPFEASEDSVNLVRTRGNRDRITAYNQARRATPAKEVLP